MCYNIILSSGKTDLRKPVIIGKISLLVTNPCKHLHLNEQWTFTDLGCVYVRPS